MAASLKQKFTAIKDFFLFLRSRIQTDNILRVASSLSYTSLIALVPFIAIGLAIFSAFPVFSDMRTQLQETLIHNLVPSIGNEVSTYINGFVSATAKLTAVGVIGIAITAVLLLSTIENSFNYIFRVYKPRSIKTKITLYWTVVTLGPLLYGAGFSMRGYFFALQKLMQHDFGVNYMFALLPPFFTLLALMMMYILVPNKKVYFLNAFWGALCAVIGFYIMRKIFGTFIASSAAYATLYGALAAIPLLLVWLYLNWTVVIFGAAITAALDEYKEEKNNVKSNGNPEKRKRVKKVLAKRT